MKLYSNLTLIYDKFQFKRIKLIENVEKCLYTLRVQKAFHSTIPKPNKGKRKVNCIKFQNLLIAEDVINTFKRNDREYIIMIYGKGLMSTLHKSLLLYINHSV